VVAAAAHAPAPVLSADQATGGLVEPRACFVTLRQGKDLRGCIGQLVAREPLWEAVVKNAEGAAIRDYRFPPVTPAEVETLRVEISVLSETVPVDFDTPGGLLAQLVPGVDGVVLRIGGCVSTFLPQVWEDLPDRERFMNHLARKAGLADEAWREAGVRVERYQVHHFEDP
jgi:AmmeMemoRadiSam system protein A